MPTESDPPRMCRVRTLRTHLYFDHVHIAGDVYNCDIERAELHRAAGAVEILESSEPERIVTWHPQT